MSTLSYAVKTTVRQGVTRDLPFGPADLQWVGGAATLIYGERDAVLVDTFTSIDQNAELVEWVKSFDRELTHIYITHGHGDHFFGIGQLLQAFPHAQPIGTAATVADAPINDLPAYREGLWEKLFPGQIPPIVYPTVLDGDHFTVEGHRFEVVDTGHTDTAHTTSLWVPELRLLTAGDVIYNRTHPFTPETTTESREQWAATADRLGQLDPAVVVAGHKQPELPDDPAIIAETATYLRDFNRIAAAADTAEEIYTRMLDLYPRWANPGSLWAGAKVSKPQPVS